MTAGDAGREATRADAPARRRIPLWDTARFSAIVLVVAGHAIQRLQGGSDAASVVYLAIYCFHIPLLVLVSGYFAKDSLDARGLRRIITDLALPYLIFETIWSVVRWLVEGAWPIDYANASWTLWFLLALIGWRLLLPLLAATRWPLAASIGVSVLAGYSAQIDSTFALSRMLGLLPFFVLGWKLRRVRIAGADLSGWWTDLPARLVMRVRFAAAALLIATVLTIALALPAWQELRLKEFLFFDSPYPAFGYEDWWAGAGRLAVLIIGATLSIAVLTLIPRREVAVTRLGAATMYVYLLHTAVLYPLRESGILADNADDLLLVVMLAASVGIAFLLSSKPVRLVFRPLVEPRATWLLAREGEESKDR
ncbi:MAG: acyltransferase family protein [Naasia sp.]